MEHKEHTDSSDGWSVAMKAALALLGGIALALLVVSAPFVIYVLYFY
jgi:hypothetical protein